MKVALYLGLAKITDPIIERNNALTYCQQLICNKKFLLQPLSFLPKGGILLESKFQSSLIKEIKEKFPGAIVQKQDARQGLPDLVIFYKDKWAMLECKKDKNAHRQPNQDYYVEKLDAMSYAAYVYPENREEILHELEDVFAA